MAAERMRHPIRRTAARLSRLARVPSVPQFSAAWRYAIPLIATLLVFLVQRWLLPQPAIAPFVFFYAGIALASWLGGRGPGLLAVALSAAVANHAFVGSGPGFATSGPALSATALFVAAGSIVALLCAAFRDSTLRAEGTAESLRRQSEMLAQKRLRSVYESGITGLIYWTVEGGIVDANDKFLEMTGYTRQDLEAGRLNWAEMTPPEFRHLDEKALRDFKATGHSPPFEKEYLRRDGSRIPILVGGAMLDEERREGVAFIVDITDRKRAEVQVQQLNRELRTRNAELNAERMWWRGVVEGIADEVWICDADGNISLINLPDTTAMGIEPFENQTLGEVVAQLEIMYPDGRPRPPEEAPLLRSLRTGEIVRGEEIMRHRGTGNVRHRQFSCAPTRDAAGNVVGAVAIVRDITDKKEAEEALREADRRKDEFLAVLSHELRNPLAPIRNSLYVLDHAAPGGEQARRAKAVIERQVNQMTRLVSDLLDVSRITRGKIQLQRERIDLRDVINRTLEDHRSVFVARGIELRSELPEGSLWVDGDPVRIAQAVGNLLQNASKFTNEGGEVAVSLYRRGSNAVLRIRDTGVGIPPEMLPRLFQPFTQADRTLDRSAGGLGLGLALVKGLIELHGGVVSAHSDGIGMGAEFTLQLPAEGESAHAGSPEPPWRG